jgi:hypothetical protein
VLEFSIVVSFCICLVSHLYCSLCRVLVVVWFIGYLGNVVCL